MLRVSMALFTALLFCALCCFGQRTTTELVGIVTDNSGAVGPGKVAQAPWSMEKAWAWYKGLRPIRGCNYLPRTAVNDTEMWQSETFDPKTIDQELGWAEQGRLHQPACFLAVSRLGARARCIQEAHG